MANKNNNIPMPLTLQTKQQNLFMSGALSLHKMGFTVIPLLPDKKRPPCKWDDWENDQSEQKIINHWSAYPEHEVGILTNPELIVFDADTQQSLDALYGLETAFEVEPLLKVKTRKGEHHYFRRPPGIRAKQRGFSSDKNPQCIDVKTDRSLVVTPPSKNKSFIKCDITHISELTEVTQEFVDAISKHNGRVPESNTRPFQPSKTVDEDGKHIRNYPDKEIDAYLDHIPADLDYDEWTKVGMTLHHEYQGGEDGLERYDKWSCTAGNYPGAEILRSKWASFLGYKGHPVTAAFIRKLAQDNGADVRKISLECSFEKVDIPETVLNTPPIVKPPATPAIAAPMLPTSTPEPPTVSNPLEKFVINDTLEDLKKEAKDAVYVMRNLAIKSQVTNVYAKANTGKTLISLKLINNQIEEGIIDGKSVYFINADDSFNGVTEKLELLIPSGINVLVPGHKDFKTSDMPMLLTYITRQGLAGDSIILFDTLKKFTDVMSKSASSEFFHTLRNFSGRGGTVINLAHTNKNNGDDGKPVYAGTTDSLDDADCAYTMHRLDKDGADTAVVELSNIKCRGNVRQKAYFQYSLKQGLSYSELFNSVQEVAPEDVGALIVPDKKTFDETPVIDAIKDCITDGINKKMELIKAVAALTDVSQRKVLGILDSYTGEDPQLNHWHFKVVERGAKIYSLLHSLENHPDIATEQSSGSSADF